MGKLKIWPPQPPKPGPQPPLQPPKSALATFFFKTALPPPAPKCIPAPGVPPHFPRCATPRTAAVCSLLCTRAFRCNLLLLCRIAPALLLPSGQGIAWRYQGQKGGILAFLGSRLTPPNQPDQKVFPQGENEFIEWAREWRAISGTQIYDPSPPPEGCIGRGGGGVHALCDIPSGCCSFTGP